MTDTATIQRTTEVVSISLAPQLSRLLDKMREKFGQTRSAFISSLIKRYSEDQRWEMIYKKGKATAEKFGIRSEEDIDRILNEK